jgi:hypothetical protein
VFRAVRSRGPWVFRLGLTILVGALLLAESARAREFAHEGHRRAQESEAREAALTRQLTNQAGVLESQRQIYMRRFRGFEALVRQKDRDILRLRARLATIPHSVEAMPPIPDAR